MLPDVDGQRLAPRGGQFLRIGEPGNRSFRAQDDGGRDDGTRKRTPACLVHTRDESIEFEQCCLLHPGFAIRPVIVAPGR